MQDTSRDLPPGALARIDQNNVVLDIARDDGFRRDEQIWYNSLNQERVRVGIDTRTKMAYKYHADRDVLVEGRDGSTVTTLCKTSRVTRTRSCAMSAGFLSGIWFNLDTAGVTEVCVIAHDFPGRTARLRVDSGRIYTTGTDGCVHGATARALTAEAGRGSTLVADYVEWPYEYRKETEASVGPKLTLALEVWRYAQGGGLRQELFVEDRSQDHMRKAAQRHAAPAL